MFRLNNGVEIPEMGLGVYKMNAGKEMDDAVRYAYEQGYRLFDTAQMYKNESGLGEALEKNRIPRQDIFLITGRDRTGKECLIHGKQWKSCILMERSGA